ncbi:MULTISPECIES: fasciclin domain-containing protein [Pacificimonas]|nr:MULTISPECIES: fasciclin domain-containing protein [Pacificimonas]MBZ6378437.1 fasciclin domain-containing protein [Pacificimonas aurantium]
MKMVFATGLTAALLVSTAGCDEPQRDPRLKIDEEVAAEEPAGPQAAEALAEREELSTLAGLMTQTNMGPALEGARSLTLFAPTNEAFEKVDPSTLEFLTAEENASTLRQLLGYHLLRSEMSSQELMASLEGGSDDTASMTTSNNYQLTAELTEEGEPVILDGRGTQARLVETDIPLANGTLHIVDTVLMPPE